ncbi:MAG: type I methionyl aminopeptidase [Chloroflexi bacterium]|nr:type I methionyl aminopeptidase [Chloroflexota bacterium]
MPLIEYYTRLGKLAEIDGEQEVDVVGRSLLATLGKFKEGPQLKVRDSGIIIKSPSELTLMREAGKVVADTLAALVRAVKPGMATGEFEAIVVEEMAKRRARPSFKGYHGFPASLCVSVNEEVVHGIPGERVLKEGDIVSLDVGAIYQGYQADAAVTVGVGKISTKAQALIEATRGALETGIGAARHGCHLGDVSAVIQYYVESRGFSVVREYVGHGIGQDMHEEPQVPNFGVASRGPLLRRGMTLALEPMVNAGDWATKVTSNGWTVVTADGSLSAHFEHTIAISDGEAEILTLS